MRCQHVHVKSLENTHTSHNSLFMQVVVLLCFGLSIEIIYLIDNNDYLDLLLSLDPSVADIVTEIQDLITDTLQVAGYMIFTGIVVLLVEISVIIGRFTLRVGVRLLQILRAVVRMVATLHIIIIILKRLP